MSVSTLRTCKYGHKYYKSSDCPTCPICDGNKKPKDGFMAALAAPARRALEKEKITSLMDLSKWSEEEIIKLHGIGPSSIPKLKKALKEEGLQFKL
jgi:hypothetical protein